MLLGVVHRVLAAALVTTLLVLASVCEAQRLWRRAGSLPDHGSTAEYRDASKVLVCAFVYGDFMNFGGGSLCELSHTQTQHFGSGVTDVIVHGNLVNLIMREVLMTFDVASARPPQFTSNPASVKLVAVYLVVGTTRVALNTANDTMGVFVKHGILASVAGAAGLQYPVSGTPEARWFAFQPLLAGRGLNRTSDTPLATFHYHGDWATAVAPQNPTKWNHTLTTVLSLDLATMRTYMLDPSRTQLTLAIECHTSVSDQGTPGQCYINVHNYNSLERRVHFQPASLRLVAVWTHGGDESQDSGGASSETCSADSAISSLRHSLHASIFALMFVLGLMCVAGMTCWARHHVRVYVHRGDTAADEDSDAAAACN